MVSARTRRAACLVVAASSAMSACEDGSNEPAGDPTETAADPADPAEPSDEPVATADAERFPDVVAVEASFDADRGTWTFDVTISSPYDSPERYADGWRVVGPDGAEYGTHTLLHDHAGEQPFTRRQSGVTIPDGVDEVTIEGRDLVNGYGGDTVTVRLGTDDGQTG